VLDELAARWELALGDAVGRGNTSLVMRCRRADGRDAILKLTPDRELARAEADALQTWQPSGRVPTLWAYDAPAGALVMEAIASNAPVSETGIALGVEMIAELIGGLHGVGDPAVMRDVPTLGTRVEFVFEHWIARHRADPSMPREVVTGLEAGHRQARALAQHGSRHVLLHDLHPANVLDGGAARGLVAIDPR
jgi:streptomycin 6-kinase